MGLLASPSLWAGWVLNLLAAAAMLITLYALMREWLGARAACVALTLSAIFPQFVTYTALMATETPTVAAMLLALWALAYSRRAACSQPFWLALGVLFYGMILLRSSCLLLLILTPLAMAAFRPAVRAQALKQAAVTLGVAGLLLSSWVFHQYLIGGQAKLFWGVELWLSSAIQYDRGGRYTHPKDMAFYPRVKPYYEGGTTADLVKAYAVIGDESLAVIRRDPFKYLAFGMTRMKNILWTAQTGLRWSQKGSARMASWSPRLIKTLAVAFNVYWQILLCLSPLGLAAVLGAALPRRASVVAQDFSDAPEDASARESQRRSFAEGGALMLGFLAAWLAFHYLTAVASERYGFQIMPLR